jgi:hypothetical protein
MTAAAVSSTYGDSSSWEEVSLVDILDRVLATGVVVTGDVTLSIAGIDLVYVSLNALVASVRPDGPGPVRLRPASRTPPDPATGTGQSYA